MIGPMLSPRALNRAVLARQLLLERVEPAAERAVESVLEAVAGLQTQYAPSGYVGLWSRLRGFRRADLTEALTAGRVVQAWVMRATIHMVSAGDYAPLTAAVRLARRTWWLRAERRAADLDTAALAAAVRRILADGPLPQAALVAALDVEGFPRWTWPAAQLWVDLVRVPPSGTWEKPRAGVFGLAPPGEAEVGAGEELLVRRYLAAFGPASARDVASFCGWTVAQVRAVAARLPLRRFTDEAGGELLDVSEGPLPEPETPVPPRFLPTWDATLLVHARRAQVLPEAYRSRVFATTMPQSVPTFLVDGQVAGTWRHTGGRIELSPFHDLPRAARQELDAEAERLAQWWAGGGPSDTTQPKRGGSSW
ncbi:winged helix DNA-binding domain-containing protein [Pseudonocardia sp.]|uniref:winged helix DNA-binding domain-containing protein n=1 Tax=Pseudonocardia sp. TaxID=60912 RepID=UPI003D0E457B